MKFTVMPKLNYRIIKTTKQKFFLKGRQPKLLIVSGTHGDEYEVVPLVEKLVMKYREKLPDFLYVPEVSPSALTLHTHENGEGLNVNRSFYQGVKSPEVKEMMALWKKFDFELFATFHEDAGQDKFYLYSSFRLEKTAVWKMLCRDIADLGIGLYTGVDDPNDPNLSYQVKNGFVHWPMNRNDHSSDYWLLVETKRAKYVINPEIPGKISLSKKMAVVEAIFQRLLLKRK